MAAKTPPQRGLHGHPHWKVELEVRSRTELTRAGVGTVLGATAEDRLMVIFGQAAMRSTPYMEEEIGSILRVTLITAGILNPVTKKPYTMQTDVSVLVAGFLSRCEEKGVKLSWKAGRKLGMQVPASLAARTASLAACPPACMLLDPPVCTYVSQRWLKSSWEILDQYGKRVAAPALLAFQKKHDVKLTLLDVGNMDEAQVDLCEFAEKGNFLCLNAFGNNVVVPFEQSPHITLKWGFIGDVLMICVMIKIGGNEDSSTAPHPHHCQLLSSNRYITLAQSIKGWTNAKLSAAMFQLQYDHPDVPLGPHRPAGAAADAPLVSKPKVVNLDGHASHIQNPELKAGFEKNDVLAMSPPAHTTAPSQRLPGTQQADASAKDGGGVARFKAEFRPRICAGSSGGRSISRASGVATSQSQRSSRSLRRPSPPRGIPRWRSTSMPQSATTSTTTAT